MERQPTATCGRTLAAIAVALGCAAADTAAQDVVYTARKLIVAPGLELDGGALLVRNGKVVAIGDEIPTEARQNARQVALDGVVLAGMVCAHSYLDQQGDLAEPESAFTPDLRAADAFDPFGEALREQGEKGITTLGLAPNSINPFAGVAAAVKPGADVGRVLDGESYLKLALVDSARDQGRYPTSLMGAADLLRRMFDQAKDPTLSGSDLTVLRDCINGNRRVAIHANSSSELATALEFCRRESLQPVLLGAAQAGDMIQAVADVGASVVLGALTLDAPIERLELAGQLAQAGVPVSFAGDAGQIRWSAALATRHGLSREAALAAITRVPAEQLGVASTVGSLRAGSDADFVVFSADPLDLSSRLLAVYIDGARLTAEELDR